MIFHALEENMFPAIPYPLIWFYFIFLKMPIFANGVMHVAQYRISSLRKTEISDF